MAGGPRSAQQLFLTFRWLSGLGFLVTGCVTILLVWSESQKPSNLWGDVPPPAEPCAQVASSASAASNDRCLAEYTRVTKDRTPGLTKDDLERSRALVGNRHRLALLAHKLEQRQQPVTAVVCGGSISLGHGVVP